MKCDKYLITSHSNTTQLKLWILSKFIIVIIVYFSLSTRKILSLSLNPKFNFAFGKRLSICVLSFFIYILVLTNGLKTKIIFKIMYSKGFFKHIKFSCQICG